MLQAPCRRALGCRLGLRLGGASGVVAPIVKRISPGGGRWGNAGGGGVSVKLELPLLHNKMLGKRPPRSLLSETERFCSSLQPAKHSLVQPVLVESTSTQFS